MTTTITIPTLETERLILRAPRLDDTHAFVGFAKSPRAEYVGGPFEDDDDNRMGIRIFGHVAGMWVMRGYGLFMAERKDRPGRSIGGFGVWHPLNWPEPEFGWTVYDEDSEHQGFVTEAMRVIIPWAFANTGLETFVSYIDDGNTASKHVARALGATHDLAAEEAVNAPGGAFHDPSEDPVTVWRHTKGAVQ